MQVVERFMCGDQSSRHTSDDDAMDGASEAVSDSVEAVGFSPR